MSVCWVWYLTLSHDVENEFVILFKIVMLLNIATLFSNDFITNFLFRFKKTLEDGIGKSSECIFSLGGINVKLVRYSLRSSTNAELVYGIDILKKFIHRILLLGENNNLVVNPPVMLISLSFIL